MFLSNFNLVEKFNKKTNLVEFLYQVEFREKHLTSCKFVTRKTGFVLHIGNSKKLHVSTTNKKKPTNLIIKINLYYGKIGETWQNKTKMKKKERKHER